jgi:hypothetical protein
MQRRSFLKAVATAVPAAGLQTFLVTQARAHTPALPPAPELHVTSCHSVQYPKNLKLHGRNWRNSFDV